jgi:DNA-binding HxlR family transcriptional regulator
MLWQHLRELERDGLLLRVVEGRTVRYELTALGEGLREPLAAIEGWSREGGVGERMLRARQAAPQDGA